MATKISSVQELYDIIKSEIESLDGDYSDFNEGSMLDILSGAFSTGNNEIAELIVSEFKKTYFGTSHGVEITGDIDDLENLAVDRYGDNFKRPKANESTGKVTFSRPNNGAGNVTIAIGTVIKTEKDLSGQEIFFETIAEVILTGLSIVADIIAQVPGADGNVDPGKIKVIETTLTDSSVTVTNLLKLAGGENAEADAEYRETIRNLIQSLAGATKEAVKGIILAVPGVAVATLLEIERAVIDYDIASNQILAGASFFRIPYPVAYIADINGNSSSALIQSVEDAIFNVRGCGVNIEILGGTAIALAWDASFTLNAGGPNFAELQNNFSKITDSMKAYIDSLDIGSQFVKEDATNEIFAIWGPSGTNDLTAFTTNSPISNVFVQPTEKIVPGIMSINGVQP